MGLFSAIGNIFSSIFTGNSQKRQAQYQNQLNLSSNKQLMQYQDALDWKSYQRELKLQSQYNNQYLSNSALATQNLNQNLMDYQYALERDSRQSSYQDTRKDLESAGYNPLLAVGQQSGYTSVGSGVSADSQQVESSNLRSSAIQGLTQLSSANDLNRQTTGNLKQIASDILSSNYTNDLHSAQAELTRSQTRGQDISNMVDSMYKEKQAIADLDLTRQQKKNLLQDISESKARILRYNYENQATSAQTALYNQERILNQPLVNFSRKHPVAGGILRSGASNIFGGIGTALMHGLLIKGRR